MNRNSAISILISFMVVTSAHAQVWDQLNSTGQYKIKRNQTSEWAVATGPFEVWLNGKLLTKFDPKESLHYHPYEIRGDQLFYLTRPLDYQKNENWEDELWAQNLKTLVKKKVIGLKGLDYRVSPNGKTVAVIIDTALHLVNIDTLAKTKITSLKEVTHTYEEDLNLISWSSDGSRFWFGLACACPESWSKLAVYENQKIRWFPYAGSQDGFLEPDRAWLFESSVPFHFDVEGRNEFEKNKTPTKLQVIDVFTGKSSVIAKSHSNEFEPKWNSDSLTYKVLGKAQKISSSEIAEKLAKAPSPEISDQAAAIRLAEQELTRIYGDKIKSQRPFRARLENAVWIVEGTLQCPNGSICKVGVALIELDKATGRTLKVDHGR